MAPSGLTDVYIMARDAVIAEGFAWEIDWQSSRHLERVSESDFLREAAWTVLSAGFRETVVRKLFGPISSAFLEWRSAAEINNARPECRRAALRIFRNKRKIDAILDIAQTVHECGFEHIHRQVREQGVQFLQTLPYVGAITSFHLAKNLGLPVVKPDRHLQRIARVTGFDSPDQMCRTISIQVGEPIQVVDIVLWRYATLFSDYITVFGVSDRIGCREERSE